MTRLLGHLYSETCPFVWLAALLVTLPAAGQDVVTNGGFENEDEGWTITQLDGNVDTDVTFVSGDECPNGGSGTCARFQVTADVAHVAVWQEVTLVAGEEIQASGAFRGLLDDLVDFWSEIVLSDAPPTEGENWTPPIMYGFNAWEGCSGAGVDGSFEADACQGELANSDAGYVVPGDEGEEVPLYLGVKVGRWSSEAAEIDVTIDDIALTGGTVTSTQGPEPVPTQFALDHVYPNPFNPSTTLRAVVHEAGTYSLQVYNVLGQLVQERAVNVGTPGQVDVSVDLNGQPSGRYLLVLKHPETGHAETAPAVLVK